MHWGRGNDAGRCTRDTSVPITCVAFCQSRRSERFFYTPMTAQPTPYTQSMRPRSIHPRFVSAFLAAALLTLALAVSGTAPAQAAPNPEHQVTTVVRSCTGAKQVQPRDLTSIYCGDMGRYVTGITWLGWTDGWAAGYGTEHRKLCKPDCATGGTASRPVGVWFFAPRSGNFTRVSLYSSVTAPPDTLQLTGYVPR